MIINKVVYGGPALEIPAHLSFGQYVLDKLMQICDLGGSVAMINGETGQQILYKQILQDTVNVATGLKKLGVKRGDRVALCSENRVEYITAALGAICCGATITTVNVSYTKDEMIHILNISQPSLLFCSEAAIKQTYNIIKTVPFIKNIIQFDGTPVVNSIIRYSDVMIPVDPKEFEPVDVEGLSDVVFLLYSSGTTGLPKGVMLSHRNALYSAAYFVNGSMSIKQIKNMKFITIVPWYHAYGLMSTINYIIAENLLVYFNGFNPQKYLNAIQEYKINALVAVPPIVVFLAKSPIVQKYDLSSVNMVWCGAAPLSAETIELAMKRMPNCEGIFQAYGMTETSLAATKEVRGDIARKSGSGGVPISGVKVKVVDIEKRDKLGPNQKGEICVKGPIIMKGYAGNEKETRNMFDEEGYLKTGDIGYYDNDGCFFIVDRLKELIKYKGIQVAPAAVEAILLQHSSVAECGVVGTPDETAGELPTAFVVLKPGAKLTEKELLEYTNAKLSPSSRLRGGIIFVKEIPKNPSGKILRRVLKQRLLEMVKKSKL